MNPFEDDKPVGSDDPAPPRGDADEATAAFRERAQGLPEFLTWAPETAASPARPAWPAVPAIGVGGVVRLDGAAAAAPANDSLNPLDPLNSSDPSDPSDAFATAAPPPVQPPRPEVPAVGGPRDDEPVADAENAGNDVEPRSLLSTLRDNVEAIAFALILALLLRHCAIEVFKIPTASMEPTLMGEDSGRNVGDRILVNKSAYLAADPGRWDIAVFHFPLDWSRNFIKRILVLPNQRFRIERGDVWIGEGEADAEGAPPPLHPARKPRTVREELYVACYPPTGSAAGGTPADWWHRVDGGAGSWQVEKHGRLVFDGDVPGAPGAPGVPAAPADATGPMTSREYGFQIRDTDDADSDPRTSGGDGFAVSDVRVRCRVTADASAEFEWTWQPGDGRVHTLRLASEGREPSYARTKSTLMPLAARLVPGRAVSIEMESVDGDLRAWVDGDEVAVIADEATLDEAMHAEGPVDPGSRPSLRVSARGGRVVVDALRIDHDLYYTNYRWSGAGETWPKSGQTERTGPDEFFMLGDNTRHSSDSRKWTARGIRLKDGTKYEYDPAPSPPSPPNPRYITVDGVAMKEITDIEGVTRRWAISDETESPYDDRRIPFVKRERIVGRAWFALVFWPLDQILPRIRFVH